MVDSIIANSTAPSIAACSNRSAGNTAVANASSMPEADVIEDIIDVTPRTMDSDAITLFKRWSARTEATNRK